MVRKPGKHQRSNQRCQDLGWEVYDHAKSFGLPSYTMHLQNGVNNYCFLCAVKAEKANKNLQQKTLSSPLLAMARSWNGYDMIFAQSHENCSISCGILCTQTRFNFGFKQLSNILETLQIKSISRSRCRSRCGFVCFNFPGSMLICPKSI